MNNSGLYPRLENAEREEMRPERASPLISSDAAPEPENPMPKTEIPRHWEVQTRMLPAARTASAQARPENHCGGQRELFLLSDGASSVLPCGRTSVFLATLQAQPRARIFKAIVCESPESIPSCRCILALALNLGQLVVCMLHLRSSKPRLQVKNSPSHDTNQKP